MAACLAGAIGPRLALAEVKLPALRTAGKDANWLKGTEKVRQLLGKLDAGDEQVARYLPAIRQRCAGLERLKTVGPFERVVYVEMFEALLEDLLAGRPPLARYAGRTVPYGYWSQHMQRLTGVKLQVPPEYDPKKEYQLFMYYKLGGGLYWKKDGKYVGPGTPGAKFTPPWRPTAEMCRKAPDTFHAWSSLYYGLKGRMGCDVELREFTAAVVRDFAVSPERIFLSGFSDGGFTALWLGSRYPHLLAGIAPEVANWQYGNVNHIGLYNVPVLVVDGWTDGGFVRENFARLHALSTMGYDFAGLFGRHGHAVRPYEDEKSFLKIMAWARTKRRKANPKRVRYATWNLTWHRAYWFSIERMIDPALAAQFDARIGPGNRIEVKTWNVAAYKLSLNDKLVDTTKPVVIITNGKESYKGPASSAITIELLKPPPGRFAKTPQCPGDITAAMTRSTYDTGGYLKVPAQRWLYVRPTGGSEAQRRILKKYIPSWAIDDTALTDAQAAGRNLFIIGGPDVNKLAARFAPDLAVKFAPGKFSIGERTYDRPAHCLRFIHPNPLNPRKHIIIFAWNDLAAAEKSRFGGLGAGFFKTSSWGFRSGDCQVFGVTPPANPCGVDYYPSAPADYYVFNSAWGPPDQAVLGTATGSFDFTAIQRLKADAVREATGADAAITWGYPPSWNRWRTHLPEGPISLNDVATIQMFPEYVMLCEVNGSQLKDLLRRALASTVVLSKDDPAYDPKTHPCLAEIDEKKTYTLAADYEACASGPLSYRIQLSKVPDRLYFEDLKAFQAAEGTALPCRKLRQSTVQVAEAIAAYIKKRGKVSPRPTTRQLNHYIANPQVNHYAAYDWAHLAIACEFPSPKARRTYRRREVLHIALRAKGEPDSFRPRENYKTFARLEAGNPAASVRIEMKKLARALPVTLTARVKRFSMTRRQDPPHYRLLEPGKGKLGQAALVTVRLVNAGEKELEGLAVLGTSRIRRLHGGYWPGRTRAGQPAPHCFGFLDRHGPRRRPIHCDAVLVLAPKGPPALERVALPNAGYNRGTIGLAWQMSLKPKASLELPVLCLGFDALGEGKKAKLPDPKTVLEAIEAQLTAPVGN